MPKSDSSILFVKPKAISQRDKRALKDAGVIVVEIDNPLEAKFVRAGYELAPSDLLGAAINAIKGSDYTQRAFGKAVSAAIEAHLESQSRS